MIFFTSDWHIGHNKDFLFRPRGFQSIEEHDEAIIKNCNEIVKPDDELWILGDLALGLKEEWEKWIPALKCKNVYYLIGNHDTVNKCNSYNEYGLICKGYANVIKYSKWLSFYLSHYPTLTGNFDFNDHPVWNLSGHTHSKSKFAPNEDVPIYNVSVDAHDNYPVSIDQIVMDIRWFYKNILMR